jgi:outer membrane protein assembly factor BamB
MTFLHRTARAVLCTAIVCALAACAATKDKRREPTPLTDIRSVLDVKQAWTASVGKAGRYLFAPAAVGDAIYAAGHNGKVVKFDAKSGRPVWEAKLDADLSAGVGSDGTHVAVAAEDGVVYALDDNGKQVWKALADGEVLTPPLVTGPLVLVRTVDGRIIAFDAQSGDQKWVYRNRAVPLNLRTTMGMTLAGQTAVLAGFPGGSLAAISLANGDVFWQTAVSYPRGVTEVERINDVAGAPTLVGRETCAVTFQGRVGCFEAETGRPLWEQPFSSYGGVAADESAVVSADDWSVVTAYEPVSGRQLWKNDQLKSRDLSGPAIVGRAVVFGDYKGYVHFLARDTGEFVARMKTDGSAIWASGVQAGGNLVIQTRDGGLYAFRPQ